MAYIILVVLRKITLNTQHENPGSATTANHRALTSNHSFKNWTGSPVQPEKTGTKASAGYLSALDQLRNRAAINRSKHGSTAGFALNQPIRSDQLINLSDGKSLYVLLAELKPCT
jgi:hypothetical protein